MGLGTAAAIGLGGAVLGGLSGAGGSQQTTSRNVANPGAREIDLQNQSFNNYMQQLALQNQQEQGIAGAQGLQDTSRNTLQNIIGGQSFNITPEEQAQIEAIRNASIQAGQGDIQNFVNQNLSGVSDQAGQRGVRGQALSELQGRTIGEGTRQYANLVGQANLTAAQQAQQAPLQRISIQGGLAQNNANFQEQLRQQAIQNRNQLQNPALLNMLQAERLGTASQTQSTPGGLGSIIGGALGGAGSLLGSYGNLNASNAQSNYYNSAANKMSAPASSPSYASNGGGLQYGGLGGYSYMAGGGVVDERRERKFVDNSKQFEKGFNGGENVSESIMNIRRALGLEPKKMAEGGVAGYNTGSVPTNETSRDKVMAMLSPNEIVIPESFSHDKGLSRAYIDYVYRKKEEEEETGGM